MEGIRRRELGIVFFKVYCFTYYFDEEVSVLKIIGISYLFDRVRGFKKR